MMNGVKRILTVLSVLALSAAVFAQGNGQIYNMSMDHWSKSGSTWYPWPKDAGAGQKLWDSANKGLSILGVNSTMPEYEHVAVKGPGKAAARLESRKVLWAFVSGNLYTGTFLNVVKTSGAKMNFGVPFSGRPKSLSGYYHYTPGTIDYAKAPYKSMLGRLDEGKVDVTLADWSSPKTIDTTQDQFGTDGDPHVIGTGEVVFRKDTGGYVRFEIPISYNDDRTPTFVVITAAASRYGGWFTGSSTSVLYIDELKFNY